VFFQPKRAELGPKSGRTSPRAEIFGAKICYVLPTDCPM
jgi:hypothetical protein